MIKVIVAGSRNFTDYRMLQGKCIEVILGLNHPKHEIEIVTGLAKGADTLGLEFAIEHGFKHVEFPAQWSKYGRGAGHSRNTEMAKYAVKNPLDRGIAIIFWDYKSAGTRDMLEKASFFGLDVYLYEFC